MGRYPVFRNKADVLRRLESGRGRGHGADYLPWLYVWEVPSRGRSHLLTNTLNERLAHTLSDLEAKCYLVFDYLHPFVTDKREQFPLEPYGTSLVAAAHLGVEHPVYPGTDVPQMVTSDLCIDVIDPHNGTEAREIAVAVKYKSDLADSRTRELLALEYETNTILKRPWFLFNEETVPDGICLNLAWLHYGAKPPPYVLASTRPQNFTDVFCDCFSTSNTLRELLDLCASKLSIDWDSAAWLFKYSVWHHLLCVDLSYPIGYLHPLFLLDREFNVLDLAAIA